MDNEIIRLQHTIQAGVAQEIALDFPFLDDDMRKVVKDLRTGLNLAMVDQGVLVNFLADKGIIDKTEYHKALIEGLKDEIQRYEARLSERLGSKINLGSFY